MSKQCNCYQIALIWRKNRDKLAFFRNFAVKIGVITPALYFKKKDSTRNAFLKDNQLSFGPKYGLCVKLGNSRQSNMPSGKRQLRSASSESRNANSPLVGGTYVKKETPGGLQSKDSFILAENSQISSKNVVEFLA